MKRPTLSGWSRLDLSKVPHGRRIIASIVVDSAGSGLLLAFVPLYFATRANVGPGALGGLMTAAALAALPAGTAMTPLVSRLGASRTLQWINYGRFAAGLVALVAVNSPVVLAALWATSWGENAFWAANGTFVSDVAGEQRQRWYAVERSIRNAAAGIGAVAGGIAVAVASEPALVILMALNTVSFLTAGLLLRPVRTPCRTSEPGKAREGRSSWTAYADWRLVTVLGVTVSVVVPLLAFAPLLMLTLAHSARWGAAATGALIALNVVILVVWQPSFTARTEHGSRRALLAKAGGAVVAAGGALALGLSQGGPWVLPLALVGLLAITYCELATNSSLYEMVSRIAPPEKMPAYMAAYQLAWATSSVVWPVATLPLLDIGDATAWLGVAGFGVAASALALLLPGRAQDQVAPGSSHTPDVSCVGATEVVT